MNPRCPYYRAPVYIVDPKTDKGYEGSAMCDMNESDCSVEHGNECEIYEDFLSGSESEQDFFMNNYLRK